MFSGDPCCASFSVLVDCILSSCVSPSSCFNAPLVVILLVVFVCFVVFIVLLFAGLLVVVQLFLQALWTSICICLTRLVVGSSLGQCGLPVHILLFSVKLCFGHYIATVLFRHGLVNCRLLVWASVCWLFLHLIHLMRACFCISRVIWVFPMPIGLLSTFFLWPHHLYLSVVVFVAMSFIYRLLIV